MEYSFALFEPKKVRSSKNREAMIEIRPNGRIAFNKKACELLASSSYCMLGYDATKNSLGILPLPEPKVNAFPVRYVSKGAYIGAKKFFKHFSILPGQIIENSPFQTGEYIGVKL